MQQQQPVEMPIEPILEEIGAKLGKAETTLIITRHEYQQRMQQLQTELTALSAELQRYREEFGELPNPTPPGVGHRREQVMNSTEIKHIQNLLSERGDYRTAGWPIAIDGKMSKGGETERAVREFQRAFTPWRDKHDPTKVFGAGVSPLVADGNPGAKTEEALRLFRWFGDRLSLNFTFNEFACDDRNCRFCGGWLSVPSKLLRGLEIARAELYMPRLGRGMRVVGGCRCERHNRIDVKGASQTTHLITKGGLAADTDPYFTWQEWRNAGTGITAFELREGYGDKVFHVDVRAGNPSNPLRFKW